MGELAGRSASPNADNIYPHSTSSICISSMTHTFVQLGSPDTFAIEARVRAIPEMYGYAGTIRIAVGGEWYGDIDDEYLLNRDLATFHTLPDFRNDKAVTKLLWPLPASAVLATIANNFYGHSFRDAVHVVGEDALFVSQFHLSLDSPSCDDIFAVIPGDGEFRICACDGYLGTEIEPIVLNRIRETKCTTSQLVSISKGLRAKVPPLPGVEFNWHPYGFEPD